MRTVALQQMHKGWFVGAFAPTVFETSQCEIAIKRYQAGEQEAAHVHCIATEITVIVSGRVRTNNREFGPDDFIILDPDTPTDFFVLDDTVTAVVRLPCVAGDKYFRLRVMIMSLRTTGCPRVASSRCSSSSASFPARCTA